MTNNFIRRKTVEVQYNMRCKAFTQRVWAKRITPAANYVTWDSLKSWICRYRFKLRNRKIANWLTVCRL